MRPNRMKQQAIGFLMAGLCLALAPRFVRGDVPPGHPEVIEAIPGLVGFWTFGEEGGSPRLSQGTPQRHALLEVDGPIQRVPGGSFSGYSAQFNGLQHLHIPFAQTGDLNICGPDAEVSMFAVVRLARIDRGVTIAGIWNEGEGANDDSGTRQYAMLLNMPTYGGPRRLTPHISSEGGVTRRADGSAFPWCCDYAVNVSEVTINEWVTLGFTYDGQYIRAYYNGVLEERPLNPAADRRTDPYFTREGPGGGPRGMNPYYHGRGIFCYDAQSRQAKPRGGSDFTVAARYAVGSIHREDFEGRMAGLAVFNRAVSAAEMRAMHEAANLPALP